VKYGYTDSNGEIHSFTNYYGKERYLIFKECTSLKTTYCNVVDALKQELAEKNRLIDELTADLDKKTRELDDRYEELDRYCSELDEISNELEELYCELDVKNRELERRNRELDSVYYDIRGVYSKLDTYGYGTNKYFDEDMNDDSSNYDISDIISQDNVHNQLDDEHCSYFDMNIDYDKLDPEYIVVQNAKYDTEFS
jgi:predicted nuclease with TOPRIM domain